MPLLQTCTASFASFIDFCSPSLGQLAASTDGLRLPLFQTYTASIAAFIEFYRPSLDRLTSPDTSYFRPTLHLLLSLLVFTVLQLVSLLLLLAEDSPCGYKVIGPPAG